MFHVKFPETVPKALTKRLYHFGPTETLPEPIKDQAAQEASSSKHRRLIELEVGKHNVAIQKLTRARQVAVDQEATYRTRIERVKAMIQDEKRKVAEEKRMLEEQERVKSGYERMVAKLHQLKARPRQQAELDM